MDKQVINADVPQTGGPFNLCVRHGDMIFVSGLPPFEDNGVLSNPVLVKHLDKIKVAVLLCGSPVGSHRWILDKDLPTERYIHVLDIDGWKEIEL